MIGSVYSAKTRKIAGAVARAGCCDVTFRGGENINHVRISTQPDLAYSSQYNHSRVHLLKFYMLD